MTADGEMLERGERTQPWSWTKLGSDAGLPQLVGRCLNSCMEEPGGWEKAPWASVP